jgi:predicted lipoprotein with Yx(FWY)xxD motif
MHRLLTCALVVASLTLAACGSGDDETSTGAPARANTIDVRHVDGIGDVLVDADGRALYTPDQEADGKILCTGECLSFWIPLDAGSGKPTAADGAGSFDVIRRPDGDRQVAVDTKPLYTFSEDTPGKVTGDGFKDDFDGQSFTWHVVKADGTKSDSDGGGGGRGGYGY